MIEQLKAKKISSKEIVLQCLKEIRDSSLNAVISLNDLALSEAEKADKNIIKGKGGTLCGVPVLIKDNICAKGLKATCASKMMASFVPTYDAFLVERLKESGAVIIGKTNMDEFAMGSGGDTGIFGKTLNPVNREYSAGGSSSGSAAAVKEGLCSFAIGTDTGGSVRIPASFCGVVGFKPTFGAVSRSGITALASSMDTAGILAKTSEDAAVVFNVIGGYDKNDSLSQEYDLGGSDLKLNAKELKIGVARELFENANPDVAKAVNSFIQKYKKAGANVVDISLPHNRYGLPVYTILANAEASSNMGRFDGIEFGYRAEKFDGLSDLYIKSRTEGLGYEVKKRIMLGNYFLSSENYVKYYEKALKVRTLIKADFDKAFEKCDVIICPTSPVTAHKSEAERDFRQRFSADINTVTASLAGLPAISIPCGTANGLPVGLQIIGKAFEDNKVLSVAALGENL